MTTTALELQTMQAIQIDAFGGTEKLLLRDVPRPSPGRGQVLVRVTAAGVGPWDAWVRAGQSVLPQPLPLTPGADFAGIVEAISPGETDFVRGDEIFGVTNGSFTGAYAEYALAETAMIALAPKSLGDTEAASIPVVASTAWQMLFDHARLQPGQRVLVLGGAGNVGAYAVQLARHAGAQVIATARPNQAARVKSNGATLVLTPEQPPPPHLAAQVDAVIDTVGGTAQRHAFQFLRPGGVLISAVSEPDQTLAAAHEVRAGFILVAVTSAGLRQLAALIDAGELRTQVGEILPLSQARLAHAMLAGRHHQLGKIVLIPGA